MQKHLADIACDGDGDDVGGLRPSELHETLTKALAGSAAKSKHGAEGDEEDDTASIEPASNVRQRRHNSMAGARRVTKRQGTD